VVLTRLVRLPTPSASTATWVSLLLFVVLICSRARNYVRVFSLPVGIRAMPVPALALSFVPTRTMIHPSIHHPSIIHVQQGLVATTTTHTPQKQRSVQGWLLAEAFSWLPRPHDDDTGASPAVSSQSCSCWSSHAMDGGMYGSIRRRSTDMYMQPADYLKISYSRTLTGQSNPYSPVRGYSRLVKFLVGHVEPGIVR
jgi:hypothetical protein